MQTRSKRFRKHASKPQNHADLQPQLHSESFEALAEGLERALAAFSGVPATHRTDNLSAAIRELGKDKSGSLPRPTKP